MPRPATQRLRHDLRAILADGAAFSLMVGLGETYLPAFALAVGVGAVGAGFLAAVPPLAGAVLQLASPGAVRALGSHRRWVVLCATTQAASFLPLIAVALRGRASFALLFVVAALYWGSGMATGPAWNTWVGTLVPRRMRAHYFAARTRVTQAGTLVGLLAGGTALELGDAGGVPLLAFALLFAVASACRFSSSRLLASQSEPLPLPANYRSIPLLELPSRLRGSAEGRFLLYLLSVQLAVQIAAPFFTPYMLQQLTLPYARYMALLAISFAAKILALPLLGLVARRLGARALLWVGGLGIVPLSSLWLVSDRFGYLLCVQVVAGSFWAAWELASFLLVFETIREDERTSILTAFNLANAVAMVGGSLVGGWLLDRIGPSHVAYMTIFALSSVARATTLLRLRRLPRVALAPLPLAMRTVAVRPDTASDDRPILPSLPEKAAGPGALDREPS